jgi:hypothetical protein
LPTARRSSACNDAAATTCEDATPTDVGRRLFPADEAALIAPLIERDAPFYDATVTREAVDGIMKLDLRQKLLGAPISYDDLIATQFRDLWAA